VPIIYDVPGTYHFTGAVAYDRLGSSWRTAAGLRSISVIDGVTGLLPTNLVQDGVPVTWLTADANSRYSFTCDVPGVVVDFGAGAEAIYAAEVPRLATTEAQTVQAIADAAAASAASAAASAALVGAPADSAVAVIMGNPASASRVVTDAIYPPTALTNRLRDQNGLLASANGVVGNGSTDDTTAMQALLTSAATFGVPVILAPLSVVKVDTLAIPSGCVLNLNGATLKRTNTSGTTVVMLNITGKNNVLIKDGTLDGDKTSYAATTEWRHGVSILGSTNVTIRGVLSKLHKGDGVYVGLNGSTGCSSIVLDRVTCDANHRQGMSVVACDGLTATSCWFTNTSGTAPQGGVDIEPNATTVTLTNLRFTDCTFAGNASYGFLVSLFVGYTATQGGITLTGCHVTGNATAGVSLWESNDFQMIGGSVSGNTAQGVEHTHNAARATKFVGVAVNLNGAYGFELTTAYTDLLFDGCTFDANGASTTGSGANIAPTAASKGARLIGNWFGNSSGSTQQYGVVTNATYPANTTLIGNTYSGNAVAPRSLNDPAVSRIDLEYTS